MKIECILKRKGGTYVEMSRPDKTYHFAPQDDDRHIAEVTDDGHIERFLAIREAYRIARTPGASADESDATASLRSTVTLPPADTPPPPVTLCPGETLMGSSEHPATFDINGTTYTLGDVVLRAFQDSGVTVENWNELTDEQRATKIDIVLDGIEDGEIVLAPASTTQQPPAQVSEADERAALVEAYTAKFGKAPAANIKIDTLKAKLAEAQG